jgi:O-antigen ligase
VNYGGYANFAMGTFSIGLGVLGFARTSVERIMGFALLGLMLLFVLLGRGRTSIWYFVIVVAVLVWHFYPVLSQKIHQNYLRVLMVAAVLSVVSVLMLSFDRITAAYQDIDQMMQDNYDSSLGHRSVMYRIGTEIVLEHPVLGVGLSHFKETKAAYLAQHDFQLSQEATQKIIGYTQIHNQFLMDMILSGVMGLVAIILFLFYPLWIYIWFYRRAGNQHLRLLALSGVLFIGYAVFASLFGTLFSYTYIAIFYMLINGFLIRFLVQHMDDVRN